MKTPVNRTTWADEFGAAISVQALRLAQALNKARTEEALPSTNGTPAKAGRPPHYSLLTRLIGVLRWGDLHQGLQAAAALMGFGAGAAWALGQCMLRGQSPLSCVRMIGTFAAIGATLPPGEREPYLDLLFAFRDEVEHAGILAAVNLGIAELEVRGED